MYNPTFSKLNIHLDCEDCQEVRTTARALYWHLRSEHGLNHDEAYNSVGNSIKKSESDWGRDDSIINSLTDRTYNSHRWKGFYEKGTESQKKEFFSKDKIKF